MKEKRSPYFKDRTGEETTTNEGFKIKIIAYRKTDDLDIQYEDGTVVRSQYKHFKTGSIGKPVDRIGEKHMSNEGYEMEIIEYFRHDNCTIRLNDDRKTILKNIRYTHILDGAMSNPYHPSVFGIGYTGEGRHKTKIARKMTKMYYVWTDMIRRAYRSEESGRDPSYVDVYVCDEWLNFQTFGDWFESKFDYTTDEVWHLDKDVRIKGNKIYSPETCAFVPREINNLFLKCNKSRGKYPLGVSFDKGKFKALIRKTEGQERKMTFDTELEAFYAYKTDKESHIKETADKWKGKVEDCVYESMVNYQVEITD